MDCKPFINAFATLPRQINKIGQVFFYVQVSECVISAHSSQPICLKMQINTHKKRRNASALHKMDHNDHMMALWAKFYYYYSAFSVKTDLLKTSTLVIVCVHVTFYVLILCSLICKAMIICKGAFKGGLQMFLLCLPDEGRITCVSHPDYLEQHTANNQHM